MRVRHIPLAMGLLLLGLGARIPAQEKLETYQLLLLESGPVRPGTVPPGGDDLHKQHLAYFDRLESERKVVALGLFSDGGQARGVAIVKADAAAARSLFEADPGVKAGRLVVKQMVLWSVPSNFGTPAQPRETEQLYFGFLNSGPDRTQSADAAKQLQAEHMAYMEGRHKEGRLVAAGPIGEGGEHRRGIVVYRATSFEEAKAIAEGDPAVQAGRLVVELHPWTVARGVFPSRPGSPGPAPQAFATATDAGRSTSSPMR